MMETGAVSVAVTLAALEAERLKRLHEAVRKVAEQMAKIEAHFAAQRAKAAA